MSETNNNALMGGGDPVVAGGRRGCRSFSTPLGTAAKGRLQFTRGASNVTLGADPSRRDLCQAHFDGPPPRVSANAGTVTIEYQQTFQPLDWRRRAARLTLNGSVSWEVVIQGGLSGLDADLSALHLGSFLVKGGASQVEITLPHPVGTVPVRLYGGTSNLALFLPAGAEAQVRVQGGVSKLAFREQRFAAIGGETHLESPGYEEAGHRYDIEISGGASDLKIVTR